MIPGKIAPAGKSPPAISLSVIKSVDRSRSRRDRADRQVDPENRRLYPIVWEKPASRTVVGQVHVAPDAITSPTADCLFTIRRFVAEGALA
jgi:hypothetical protein